ncbi:MAG: DUF2075 domain-containing protein [Hyphomonadaceae bacterium]
MAGYYSSHVTNFLATDDSVVAGQLSASIIANHSGDYDRQLSSWRTQIALLKHSFERLLVTNPQIADWGLIVEYPLPRVQKRLDVVVIAGASIAVIEFKVGGDRFAAADIRQVEDYALDLRDFHAESTHRRIWPVLCVPDASASQLTSIVEGVAEVATCNSDGLTEVFRTLAKEQLERGDKQFPYAVWEAGRYWPVPTIVQAAELLFAKHNVENIASAASKPENLGTTTDALIGIIERARANREHIVAFVTGVPGSGKTLVGLNAVHDARFSRSGQTPGAYLSGNSPLVRVLREALADDDARRNGRRKADALRFVKAKVQTLMDFLSEYLNANDDQTPADHVIVFDEAQRAWDAAYGKQKFNRPKSEASLFLEIMGRHDDWAVIIALVGGGQEINRGELGLSEWGRAMTAERQAPQKRNWRAIASREVIDGGEATAWQSLFDTAAPDWYEEDARLHLSSSIRSYRCEALPRWVNSVLSAEKERARQTADAVGDFPVFVTRDLDAARAWLRKNARGERRYGLVASSGAKRLRAEALGVSLGADNLDGVAHWFLRPRGDIRSSYALEVTANEYACQGLELDYVGLCWGGDLIWNETKADWTPRRLNGQSWQTIGQSDARNWTLNKYRVLLTRARLGTVIWVPGGDAQDPTRPPKHYDDVAKVLTEMGAHVLD